MGGQQFEEAHQQVFFAAELLQTGLYYIFRCTAASSYISTLKLWVTTSLPKGWLSLVVFLCKSKVKSFSGYPYPVVPGK